MPGGQGVHEDSASAWPYVPGGHGVQGLAPPRPKDPRGHTDAVGVAVPGTHSNPGGTSHGPEQLGVVRPLSFPYRPASHSPLQAA